MDADGDLSTEPGASAAPGEQHAAAFRTELVLGIHHSEPAV